MARALVIPDAHLKTWVIKQGMELADKLFCDRVILLGDYFDDWYAMDSDYDEMYHYLKELLRKNPGRIIPLLGNHELSYLGFPCSGHKRKMESVVKATVENDYRFLWAYSLDGVLYSHAGFTTDWVVNNKLIPNHMVKYHMGKMNGAEMCEGSLKNLADLSQLAQAGPARGGHGVPSPVWADLSELIEGHIGNFTQVVGHTPVEQIEFYNGCYFTDVFSNGNDSDEYLFVVDGEPKIVHYNEIVKGEPNV